VPTCVFDLSLEIFFLNNTHSFLKKYNGFIFECLVWIKMMNIKQKYYLEIISKCVIIRSEILQKLRIFSKWVLCIRHQISNKRLLWFGHLVCFQFLSGDVLHRSKVPDPLSLWRAIKHVNISMYNCYNMSLLNTPNQKRCWVLIFCH
jgi:hypothetical protein